MDGEVYDSYAFDWLGCLIVSIGFRCLKRVRLLEQVPFGEHLSYYWFNLYQTWMNDASCDADALDRLRC